MKINTKYNNPSLSTFPKTVQPLGQPTGIKEYGRVKSIVLDESHPDFLRFGRLDSLLGIRVYPLKSELDENNVESLPFAKSFDLHIKNVPLINEIVEIFPAPEELLPSYREIENTLYYSRVLNTYNSINHGALPQATEVVEDINLGEGVEELSNKTLLNPFPGDTLIQGRTGGSIRISGYKHPKNVFSTNGNNGEPFIILCTEVNTPSAEVPTPYVESLNNPGTILFLGSNHNVNLDPILRFVSTYKQNPQIKDDYTPTPTDNFIGSQFAVKSDRVVFQAGTDAILLTGRKTVGIIGDSVNLEGNSYIALDAPKIFIGGEAKTDTARTEEPAVRGEALVEWEKDLLRELKGMARAFSTVTSPFQAAAVLTQVGNSLIPKIEKLERKLVTIKSKKVFIE